MKTLPLLPLLFAGPASIAFATTISETLQAAKALRQDVLRIGSDNRQTN